jgi:serine protease Do
MFNIDGEVIGVNTAIFSPTGASVGIGFAIPSNIAEHVINQLREFGRTRRGWLGVRIQRVTPDLADGLGLDRLRGALVADITPGGPAAGTGIARGDVVIEFNGQNVSDVRELPRLVAGTPIGTDVPVVVWRDGRAETFTVRIGDLEEAEDGGLLALNTNPGAEAPADDVTVLGMRLAAITPSAREEYQLPAEITGVLVLEVEGDSNAAQRGVRPGDVIREINREVVDSPNAVVSLIQGARRAGSRTVLALVETEGDSRFVALSVRNAQ